MYLFHIPKKKPRLFQVVFVVQWFGGYLGTSFITQNTMMHYFEVNLPSGTGTSCFDSEYWTSYVRSVLGTNYLNSDWGTDYLNLECGTS